MTVDAPSAGDTLFTSGFEGTAIATVDAPLGSVGWHSSIAIGADGLPVISYHDSTAGLLKVAKCNDPGCAGGNETVTVVDGPEHFVGAFSSITLGADGLPLISYWDQTAFSLRVAKCADAACAGPGTSVSVVDGADPLERAGLYTSVAIGADGLPVISYIDDSAFALKVAKCNDPRCAGGDETISVIDDESAKFVGLYTSIAIGADGFPVIAYYFSNGALKIAKCNDPACAGADETLSYVDYPVNRVGWDPAIAIGMDGSPVISYFDITASALKVAKCNDPACSGGDETITTVDDPGNLVGAYTSIAVGADGLPVIGYHDMTAGSVKVAICADPACATSSQTVIPDDPTHRVGRFTSMAIGSDGLPVISYRDESAGALKVIKCGHPSCTGGDEAPR